MERYVIGNKKKTRFLGWDELECHYKTVNTIEDSEIELYTVFDVERVITNNRYDNFFVIYDLKYKYKIDMEMKE
jgi:hypothetical protein